MVDLSFPPFDFFVKHYTVKKVRDRWDDSEIEELDITDSSITAKVRGTRRYTVKIEFTPEKVTRASCTCPYDHGGYCKHVVNVLANADGMMLKKMEEIQMAEQLRFFDESVPELPLEKEEGRFVIRNQRVLDLTEASLNRISVPARKKNWRQEVALREAVLPEDELRAILENPSGKEFEVSVLQNDEDLFLSCSCDNPSDKLCEHISFIIKEILRKEALTVAFDKAYRNSVIQEYGKREGLDYIANIAELVEIKFAQNQLILHPKHKLLSLSDAQTESLERALLPPPFQLPKTDPKKEKLDFILVKIESKGYYGQHKKVSFSLMDAPLSKAGEIKSPLRATDVRTKLKEAKNHEELLFFSALLQQGEDDDSPPEMEPAYADIVKNPLQLPFYFYEEDAWSLAKPTPKNTKPIQVRATGMEVSVLVKQAGDFFTFFPKIEVDGKKIAIQKTDLIDVFFIAKDVFHFVSNKAVLQTLQFFHKNDNREIYIHESRFDAFKAKILDKMEQSITVSYDFSRKAPAKFIREKALDKVSDWTIYLSEEDDYILFTPTVRYGDIEVGILSKKTVYATGPDGSLYAVERDRKTEKRFLETVQKQHPDFDKHTETEFFYLHKSAFLEDEWFLDAFENWRNEGIAILGFNQLKSRYNPHKMTVTTRTSSGIDWFDLETDISFGDQKVGLKDIRKAILNKSRFVQLGDGSQGILPQEWIDKFGRYFRSGEIKGDSIRTHKTNFSLIDELFAEEVLSEEIRLELKQYREKLQNFHSIENVSVPKKLKATLRDYQKEGLNWLNFLDEFGFGGCLADDMGLGKTIQIIAYFLAQHKKGNKGPNLVIVPTSLLFNWQREVDRFAPHLRYIVLHGINRETEKVDFSRYDVVFTTYGTMISDIETLRKQPFNIIVLDESQAIKNPESKRYKAARLLQARQRLVATGTPIENNTFDLYAQLSFVLPGLFGSSKRFAEDYSTPIDKFQDTERAAELQRRIHPFVLRRTKSQVAKELPEKTEMTVYCEMDTEQRRVYDTHKAEFQQYLMGLSEEEVHKSGVNILQGLIKLRQICNSPALLSDEEFYGDQSAKLDELLRQIDKLKSEHKVLVFSQFVGMLDLIKSRLDKAEIKYAYLTGQTRKREEQVELFQNDDSVRVFLISLKAGGTGLNLTQAEYVFIVDPWWNPAVENQAIDRAYRIGQQNKVMAIRLITPDTIEEKITELQQRKRRLAEDLIHTDTNVLKQLSKDDLLGMV